jgi:AraC family transcriptional regulator
MTASNGRAAYDARFNRVTAFIYDHLDDAIDLNKLAEIACLSPYHWHRIYHAMYGETIAATVKRLRLHRAAGFLAQTAMPIAEVAKRSGYKSLQSFTRVFAAVYGMPPAQYRKRGSHTQFQPDNAREIPAMYQVAIKDVPRTEIISVDHTGSYMQIGKAFDTLYGWLAARNLLTPQMRSVGVFFDDPDSVTEAELHSRAGVILPGSSALAAPLKRTEIAAGSYAVLRHKGPYADMRAAYQWLYGDWLMRSGREVADAPMFEEYLNSPRDTAPTELLSDIYLPLS